jgi:hypothetical protein
MLVDHSVEHIHYGPAQEHYVGARSKRTSSPRSVLTHTDCMQLYSVNPSKWILNALVPWQVHAVLSLAACGPDLANTGMAASDRDFKKSISHAAHFPDTLLRAEEVQECVLGYTKCAKNQKQAHCHLTHHTVENFTSLLARS